MRRALAAFGRWVFAGVGIGVGLVIVWFALIRYGDWKRDHAPRRMMVSDFMANRQEHRIADSKCVSDMEIQGHLKSGEFFSVTVPAGLCARMNDEH